MPSSFYHQIGQILDVIVSVNPRAVLDVGVGFGKYGFLSREYLDVYGKEREREYGDFRVRIDGIEAFPKYITPLHRMIYDHIYEGDAAEVIGTVDAHYGLALMIDVLEHFDRDRGLKLVQALLERCDNVLISVPSPLMPQDGEAFGNPFEEHRHGFCWKDFDGFESRLLLPNSKHLIVLLGKSVASVRKERRDEWIRRSFPTVLALLDGRAKGAAHRVIAKRFPAALKAYRRMKSMLGSGR